MTAIRTAPLRSSSREHGEQVARGFVGIAGRTQVADHHSARWDIGSEGQQSLVRRRIGIQRTGSLWA